MSISENDLLNDRLSGHIRLYNEAMKKLIKAEAERDQLREERDALAAHIEDVLHAWAYADTGIHDKYDDYVLLPNQRYYAIDRLIMDSPKVSLARRDLLKQAEVLEGLLAEQYGTDFPFDAVFKIEKRATELRQQAEALK